MSPRDLDLAPTNQPMRPHRKPRHMRRAGRHRSPYCPHGQLFTKPCALCCSRPENPSAALEAS